MNLAQKYNFIDDGLRFKDTKLKKSFIEYMFTVIWGSADMNLIPASDLMLKLKAFLKQLELSNIIKIPRFHEDMFLLVKELLLNDGANYLEKVTKYLFSKYFNNNMLLMQSDYVDLYIINVILELAYDTYPKIVPRKTDKEYEDQRDTELREMPEGGLVDKDATIDPNLSDEDNYRCKEMDSIRLIIDNDFPPCGLLSRYLTQFFDDGGFIDVSIESEKSLIDKYLFLN